MLCLIVSVIFLDFITVHIEGVCTKFASRTEVVPVEVHGRCVYGFSQTKQHNAAESLCSSEGTQLIVLQTTEDQQLAFDALGSNFNQHWVGLYKRNNNWEWKYDSSWIPMTMPSRWEATGSGSDNVSYTMSSVNRYLLKMASVSNSYRPVCEEFSATSQDPPPNSPPTDSPSPYPAPASPPSDLSDVPSNSLFTQVMGLNDTITIDSISVVNIRYCVLNCLRQPDCSNIMYDPTKSNCLLTKQVTSELGLGYNCETVKCFTKNMI